MVASLPYDEVSELCAIRHAVQIDKHTLIPFSDNIDHRNDTRYLLHPRFIVYAQIYKQDKFGIRKSPFGCLMAACINPPDHPFGRFFNSARQGEIDCASGGPNNNDPCSKDVVQH